MSRRFAAVDCGTNSIRLLIADARYHDGVVEVTELHRLMEIVRLGQGVDATGTLASDALARVRAALERYVELMKLERVAAVRMVATSATRDASNREEFFEMTRELLAPWDTQAEVITGQQEAALSFRGAIDDLPADQEPFCVIDVGGGSTEVIVGDHAGNVRGSLSVPLGSVRITERFLHSSPASPHEISDAREFVAYHMDRVRQAVDVAEAHTVVGCAGTFTTLSALAQGLESYDPAAIHGSRLRFNALRPLNNAVVAADAQTLAANPVMHPGRADVFAGGVLVVDGLMDLFETTGTDQFVISEKDILDGIVAGLIDDAEAGEVN